MAPIIIRAFRVIALYEEKKEFLVYLRNRNVILGLLLLSLGIGTSSLLEQSNVEQRNNDGNCLLFYHYYYLLSVFVSFLLLMSFVSYRIYFIFDTFRVSTELFGHLILGFVSGVTYCFLVFVIKIDLVEMKAITQYVRPNYYISLYGAIGMYLSFVRPMNASFYRTNEFIEISSNMPEENEDDSSNHRGSLINMTASLSPRPSSNSQPGVYSTSSNPITVPSTTTRKPSSETPSFLSHYYSLSYSELMNTSVDELLQHPDTRIGLQVVARNALCPELVSFLLDIQSFKKHIDSSFSSGIAHLSASFQSPPLPTIRQGSELRHSEIRSHSISHTPASSAGPTINPLPSIPEPQTRTSRSNSLFGVFAPLLAPTSSISNSHRPQSTSISHLLSTPTPPSSLHSSTANMEYELLYKEYLNIIDCYMTYNSLQEVNISMTAKQAALEIQPKHIFFQSSMDKMKRIFDISVREVHSVIRNNLYGDLRRYFSNVSQRNCISSPAVAAEPSLSSL